MDSLRRLKRFSVRIASKPGGLLLPGFVLFFLLHVPVVSAGSNDVVDLLKRARERQLSERPYWRTLLHFRPGWRGVRSLIDDPRFFLAPDGASDAEAELAATLQAFFAPVDDRPDDHARCRFPARYDWLDRELGLSGQLPPLTCPKYEKIEAEIEPLSAELIFPGSNFNNPASMFGHTLININGPYRSKLLSHALNYSAFTREKNGFAYAVKGIFGFYRGFYSVLPYYAKLKQYNDLERRDIWEYELNLDREEMERMFRHIWELEDIYSDYYFFDENCAYQLLFLFDAARPSMRLADRARPWVIPVDTVRLLDDADVIESAAYRPSKATRIAWTVEHMSPVEKDLAERLLSGALAPDDIGSGDLSVEGKVRVLDLAIETVEFRYLRRDLAREDYRRLYLALLKQRSYLKPEREVVPEIPVPVRPDKGHGSYRLSLQGGEVAGEPFAELQVRPAYHSLLDDDDGYLAGSQIVFGNVNLRHYTRLDKLRLHAFDLVSIVSLTPRHRFYRPVSWKVDAGFRRQMFADGPERMVFSVNPGGGFTFGSDRHMLYGLIETDLQVAERYRDDYMLGFGGSAGLLTHLGETLKLQLAVRQIGYTFGDRDHRALAATGGINWTLGVNSSLIVAVERRRDHGVYRTEARGGLNVYW